MPPRRAPPPPRPELVPLLSRSISLLPVVTAGLAAAVALSALVSARSSAVASRRAWEATAPLLAASAAQAALSATLAGPGRDWALAYAGGRVTAHSPLEPGTPAAQAVRGRGAPLVHPRASAWVLTPPPGGVALPGACLPLAGTSGGWVELRLAGSTARPPRVTGLSVDAPPAASAWPDGLAALPAVLSVSLSEAGDGSDWVEGGEVRLAEPAPGVVPPVVLPLPSPGRARLVRLRVVANRGWARGTCLHRVRVHGEE